MPNRQISSGERKSVLWIALGRQRVGKTTVLNAAVQYFREKGCPIEVWNADQQNRSHSLSTFFADALVPPPGGLVDGKLWIEERLMDQVRRRVHAVLDAGGGWTGFSSLVEDVPLVGVLGEQGIQAVGLFCVGPERADLDYLEHFASGGLFLPEATMIVLNAGLVLSGRSAGGAFAAVRQHPAFRAAVEKGARIVMMPPLVCMAEVTDRGLTFSEAADGTIKPSQEPLSIFDRPRVHRWWRFEMPDFFRQFPDEWLPVNRELAELEVTAHAECFSGDETVRSSGNERGIAS
jgi:hypothetical protein